MRKTVKKATKEPDNAGIPKGYAIDTEYWIGYNKLDRKHLDMI